MPGLWIIKEGGWTKMFSVGWALEVTDEYNPRICVGKLTFMGKLVQKVLAPTAEECRQKLVEVSKAYFTSRISDLETP
jgi:hypothetical protein